MVTKENDLFDIVSVDKSTHIPTVASVMNAKNVMTYIGVTVKVLSSLMWTEAGPGPIMYVKLSPPVVINVMTHFPDLGSSWELALPSMILIKAKHLPN